MIDTVGSACCGGYEPDAVLLAVRAAVAAAGGLPPVAGKRVLLKPNLLSDAGPDTASTTHPEVVYAVGRLIAEAGGTVIIADSPGAGNLYTRRALNRIYLRSGIAAAAERLGAELSFDTTYDEVSYPAGVRMKRFTLIRPVRYAEVIISVCKLKTHMFTQFSGAVKNTFGVVPGLDKPVFHSRFVRQEEFSEMLVDLNELVRPDFVVMDAVVGMEGNGPMGGDPRFAGYVFASRSVYALDVVAQQLIGMEPDRIATTAIARGRGLLDAVDVCGDPVVPIAGYALPPTYHVPSENSRFRRAVLSRFQKAGKLYAPVPHTVPERCTGCGQCVRICPEHAVLLVSGVAVFDLHMCIRCYCCHEMCRFHAIELKTGLAGRILHRILG